MYSSKKVALFLIIALALIFWVPFPILEVNQCPVASELETTSGSKPRARLAITCCEERSREALVLIKSAFLFSQDADLDIFVIADETCGPIVAEGVELLKDQTLFWKSQFDVKFIPYQVPIGTEHWEVPPQWLCSTSRLFLHKILPEDIDAVLYMDTDSLFLSNVTEIWHYFVEEHRQHPYAVVTLADHVPPPAKYLYHFRDIPFSGNGGINSGTIFMNLTRLRKFNFEQLAYDMYEKYNGRLKGGPDQDILNIVFATHKENATIMDCSYSFHPEHCGDKNGESYNCPLHSVADGPLCFCWSVFSNGVKLMHAYGQSFHEGNFSKILSFWKSLWDALEKVKLDSAAVLESIQSLKQDWGKLQKQPPCFSLTPEVLYRNAEEYLGRILKQDQD